MEIRSVVRVTFRASPPDTGALIAEVLATEVPRKGEFVELDTMWHVDRVVWRQDALSKALVPTCLLSPSPRITLR